MKLQTLPPLIALAGALFIGDAYASNAEFTVTLQTFGEGVLVELRKGTPVKSNVVKSRRTNGGTVRFADLCPGGYFLAIGNDDSVSVTPVRQFQEDHVYSSKITLQRSSGNVATTSRKSL